jgi:phosphotransferase system enzyme I (PtsI)
VPSAVIVADVLAREVDFFSIGTNDLIQYTLAIDRENENVSYLYSPVHQAILRMVAHTVAAGRAQGIEVAMCGEMAGDIQLTMLLLGMGVDSLSMRPAAALKVKQLVRLIDLAEAGELARDVMTLSSRLEISNLLRETMYARFPDVFKDHAWTL